VIPVLVDPPPDEFLNAGEVDHPPHSIQRGGNAGDVDFVVVSVEVGTLVLVPDDAVGGTEAEDLGYGRH
jgi:hypothetical protein